MRCPKCQAENREGRRFCAECAKFIDWKNYRLGRLQSEVRTEYKKSVFE